MILQTSLVKLHLPEPEKHGSREDVLINLVTILSKHYIVSASPGFFEAQFMS